MLDFILGLLIAGLLVRGWLRGFVRELLDLVGLVVGLWIAVKLSGPMGDFLTDRFAVTPEVARIGAGIALFLLFGVALSVAAHYLSKVMGLPGLNLINRAGGAAVAGAWGLAILVVLANVVRVLPIPEGWESEVENSTVVGAVAGPGALPQEWFDSLAGDNVLAALAAIQDVFGSNRAVPEGNDQLVFPPAQQDEIRQVRDEAQLALDQINEHRAGLDLRALQASTAITEAAEMHAESRYTNGIVARSPDCLGSLRSFGARVVGCGEGIALAGSALGALDGVLDSETGNAELSDPRYDRAGAAVVDGPTGRMLVVFLGR